MYISSYHNKAGLGLRSFISHKDYKYKVHLFEEIALCFTKCVRIPESHTSVVLYVYTLIKRPFCILILMVNDNTVWDTGSADGVFFTTVRLRYEHTWTCELYKM